MIWDDMRITGYRKECPYLKEGDFFLLAIKHAVGLSYPGIYIVQLVSYTNSFSA